MAVWRGWCLKTSKKRGDFPARPRVCRSRDAPRRATFSPENGLKAAAQPRPGVGEKKYLDLDETFFAKRLTPIFVVVTLALGTKGRAQRIHTTGVIY